MTEAYHQQLESFLRNWAKSRIASDEQLRQLRDRILMTIERRPAESFSIAEQLGINLPPRPSEAKTRALWYACGVAAIILSILGYISRLGPPSPTKPLSLDDEVLATATELGALRLDRQSRLLTEMQTIFDGQLEWVAEKHGKVQIGLTERDVVPNIHDQALPLTIRVVVAKRVRGASGWTIEWSTDIVAKNERAVIVAMGEEGDGHLRLCAYRMPEGSIAVDTQFESSRRMPVAASFGAVQKEGKPQKVFTSIVGDTEYKIIQTVATLSNDAT